MSKSKNFTFLVSSEDAESILTAINQAIERVDKPSLKVNLNSLKRKFEDVNATDVGITEKEAKYLYLCLGDSMEVQAASSLKQNTDATLPKYAFVDSFVQRAVKSCQKIYNYLIINIGF